MVSLGTTKGLPPGTPLSRLILKVPTRRKSFLKDESNRRVSMRAMQSSAERPRMGTRIMALMRAGNPSLRMASLL